MVLGRNYIFYILLAVGVCLLFFKCGRDSVKVHIKEKKVIEQRIDTIKGEVQVVEKEVVKYKDRLIKLKEKELEIVYDTIACKEIVDVLKEQIHTSDTIIQLKDTIIYKEREIVKETEKIVNICGKSRGQKLNWGLIGGYNFDGKKFKPSVGVGISFNPFL